MSDTPEVIRQQMEETKSHLSGKLESLEDQVSGTMQSAGTAVTETVEAVRDVAQSVSHAFDLQRHVHRHPWLVLGGSVALGYLAVEFLGGSAKQSAEAAALPHPDIGNAGGTNKEPSVESAANTAALAAAYESGLKSSSWHQLKVVAIGALIGIAQEVVVRAVPQVMDYFTGKQPLNGSGHPEDAAEIPS